MTDEEQEKIERYADAICAIFSLVIDLMSFVIFLGVFAWAWGQL